MRHLDLKQPPQQKWCSAGRCVLNLHSPLNSTSQHNISASNITSELPSELPPIVRSTSNTQSESNVSEINRSTSVVSLDSGNTFITQSSSRNTTLRRRSHKRLAPTPPASKTQSESDVSDINKSTSLISLKSEDTLNNQNPSRTTPLRRRSLKRLAPTPLILAMGMDTKNNCEVCSKPARQFCSSCKAVFYCSKECQKQDWKMHKGKCKPFNVQNHAIYGRYLVASREIKPGEILMKEPVTLLGPKNRTVPLCLGCHKKITGSYKCSKCQFPMCASYCEVSQHHKAECVILSRVAGRIKINEFDSPSPAYECITPLRLLLKKETAPDKWKSIDNLQSHDKDLANSSHMYAIRNNTVNFIREFVGWKEASEEEIIKACGILITNALEVQHNGQKVHGLYPMAAMMAHDCVPNTKHVFDDDLNIIVRATKSIPKGEAITMTYTETLWHSLSRRQALKTSKFFNCICKRCCDKTELGTNMSTLLCVDCQKHVKSVDPLDPDARWSCDKCSHTIRGKDVRWGDNALYKELRNLDNTSVEPLEEFIDAYKKTLHSQHRFLVEAKYGLIRLYGTVLRYRDMTREQLETKVAYCRELLKIAAVIDPGMSLLRGTLLFELQAGLVGVAKYLISNELVSKDQAQEYMTEAMKYLQEATVILKHEPEMEKGGMDQMLKKLQEELDM